MSPLEKIIAVRGFPVCHQQKCILYTIATYLDGDEYCTLGLDKLSYVAGIGKPNLVSHLKKLIEAGLLYKKISEKSYKTNQYAINFNWICDKD